MRTIDFTPLFRHSVGFDRLERMLESATRMEQSPSYPPYNIKQLGEDAYLISMAVAGFSDDDLEITVTGDTLLVTGRKAGAEDAERAEDSAIYLHRGIAERAFEHKFQLADDIKVQGGSLENGLLHVELKRIVPEEKKPRKIAINGGSGATAITNKKAA